MLFDLLPRNRSAFITPSNEWLRAHCIGISRCPKCPAKLLPGYFPKPIEPWLEVLPKKQSVNGLFGAPAACMRMDLVDVLRPHMPNWVWGKCFNLKGGLIPTHLTCYEEDVLWLRGDEHSTYRGRCTLCGRPGLTRQGFPRVLRRDLRSGKHVYQGQVQQVLITEALANQINWSPFKDIELFRVVEIDEPMDGLPADVRDWPNEPRPPLADTKQK